MPSNTPSSSSLCRHPRLIHIAVSLAQDTAMDSNITRWFSDYVQNEKEREELQDKPAEADNKFQPGDAKKGAGLFKVRPLSSDPMARAHVCCRHVAHNAITSKTRRATRSVPTCMASLGARPVKSKASPTPMRTSKRALHGVKALSFVTPSL